MEIGRGYWVKLAARRVAPSSAKPHGIDYSLCLFSSDNERLICFDNAHPLKTGSGPSKRATAINDHVHRGKSVKPYPYSDAGELVADFWTAVDETLKSRGMP